MHQPKPTQLIHDEGQISLAIQAINQGHFLSIRAAADAYNVDRFKLTRRRAGIPSRRDCTPNSKKLTDLEESVIIQYILDLDSRGFPPRYDAVRDMANRLLAARRTDTVGEKWAYNFVKRQPELKSRFSRKYDYKRAQNEDPEVIRQWFELVRNTRAKYGILDDDVYNFDETGFMMGVISTGMVITASERRHRPKALQPGNRKWVTEIQGINAQGWAIPPFIIFAGQFHLSAWYSDDIPHDWVIALSENGWTTNELGFQWLQHFDKHTKSRTKGSYRLLIIDGHESHHSLEFRDFCEANKIITLCMPSHSSHLLQPLDVGCFAPLKQAYGRQVEDLMRNHINHITNLEFLPAFRAAFEATFTKENITGGFRGAGLIPYDPEAVVSNLNVRLRTPTPPAEDDLPWEAKTPANQVEMASQTELIKDKIVRHQNSSPTPITDAVDQFLKGAHRMAAQFELLKAENASLRKANEAATRRKQRKKKRIQQRGTLTIQEGLDLINQAGVGAQNLQEKRQGDGCAEGAAPSQRRCGNCRETGHNSRTCPKGRENPVD